MPGDPDLAVPEGKRGATKRLRQFAESSRKFYMEERGRNYFDTSKDRGRYLKPASIASWAISATISRFTN